ncbi:MAG: TrkH family potassium uptake protein [Phycisphaerae bacterium]
MFETLTDILHRCSAWLFARSERLLAVTFFLLIFMGTVLLWLPISHKTGQFSFLDASFTSTSAVCVTGLVVADTGRDFSWFGQLVIMFLIQLGGLGIMTFAAVTAQLIGGKLSFRSQAVLGDAFYQGNAASSLRHDLKRIVAVTFLIEALGAVLLYHSMSDSAGDHEAWFSAIFHSISAFCNAGFSLYTDSLTRFHDRCFPMGVVMMLIILGGLGNRVVLETLGRIGNGIRRRSSSPLRWSLQTRVVLWMSASLILIGTLLLASLDAGHGEATTLHKLANALFQSVTSRTAGFNTIRIDTLATPTLLVIVLLMFIGGSPASCAGGVKTTSLAAWFAQLRSWMTGRKDVLLLGRRLSGDVVARAGMIIGLGVTWVVFGTIVLTLLESGREGMGFDRLLFEQVSAFGTVGLSTGITASLTAGSRIWIILSMFVGRIGPLAFAMVISQQETDHVRYPEEHLMVG